MDPRLTHLRGLRTKMAMGQLDQETYNAKRLELINAITGTLFPILGAGQEADEIITAATFEVKEGGPSHAIVVAAVFSNNLEMLKRHIVAGGSVNSRESESRTTILMIASGRGYGHLVEWYDALIS